MFWMDKKKVQDDATPAPGGLPADVIVSPDTRRERRRAARPVADAEVAVLDASGPPEIDLERWSFRIAGLVEKPAAWDWRTFQELPRVKVFSDFHCVTRWSRLGNLWEGPSTHELVRLAGGALQSARFVQVFGHDGGWSTNMPLEDFLAEDALVALQHDGEPIAVEHGGPARLIVPRLYAWKSAKWVAGVELVERDRAGFWEKNGYHMHGDPWTEERHSW